MKNLIIIFLVLLFNSCYWNCDLNDYEDDSKHINRQESYMWYYDPNLISEFYNYGDVNYCQFIGQIKSSISNDVYYMNRRCYFYNDTIYIKERNINPEYDIFDGQIYYGNIHDGLKKGIILKMK